jgi:pimeloyl-ACP methyl ester carboxylesterase
VNQDYDSVGADDAPPILFLHGVATTRKAFLPQMAALSADFRLLAVDLSGHGVRAEQPFSFPACIPVIDAVIQTARCGRVLLAGSSLGAYVALAYAAQQPERVAGLALSGCGIDFSGGWSLVARSIAATMRLGKPLMQPLMKAFERWNLRRLAPQQASAIQAAGYFYDGWQACYAELASFAAYAQLRIYRGPVLIANGSYDFHRPFQHKLAAAAQQPTVQIIDGASHFPNLEQPERYNQALREFATTIFGRGSPSTR